MVFYSALHWAKKAEKSAEKCEQIQEDLDASGLDLSKYARKSDVESSISAVDSKAVHKTGDETIADIKTFTSEIISTAPSAALAKITNRDSTVKPSTFTEVTIAQNDDKNGVLNTSLRTGYTINGDVEAKLYAGNKGVNKAIGVAVRNNGTAFTFALTPGAQSSTTGVEMATTGWVNDPTKSANVVHRTGDEDVEGKKRFKSYQGALYVRFTGSDSMTAPSSDLYNVAIRCEDKNGKNTGNFRNVYSTSGHITTDMQVCREVDGSPKYAQIQVTMSPTGVVSTSAPNPTQDSNSTHIATTNWVRTLINNSSDVVESGENWVKFKKGLILQWGVGAKGATRSITLPKPFTTTSYNVICTNTSPDGYVFAPTVDTKTTTSFIIHCYGGASKHDTMWFAIGF